MKRRVEAAKILERLTYLLKEVRQATEHFHEIACAAITGEESSSSSHFKREVSGKDD